MGILKSVETTSNFVSSPQNSVNSVPVVSHEPTGNYDVFRFFSVDPFAEKDPYVHKQINEISSWAKEDGKTVGDALWKIRKMETKLGVPQVGETRYTKMYNYVKMAKITESLEKERNQQLERAKKNREAEINKLKAEKEKELKNLEEKRKRELAQLNKQHNQMLKPLYRIRSAFERG